MAAGGGGPPVSGGVVEGATGAVDVSGAGPGVVDEKGSRPGAAEAVVGELTTGAGGTTTTGGAWGFCLGALEQPAQHRARAVRHANQKRCLCVGCIYNSADT